MSLDTGPLRDSFPELRTLELCGSFSSETYDVSTHKGVFIPPPFFC